MKLQGKVAMITGAAQGIGREYALRFGREGAAVVIADIRDNAARDHARSRAYRWGEDGIAGFCDDRAKAVPVLGAVERPRSDIEGAPVRADQLRRQSRRGRQGALLLSGCHAHAFVLEDALQVSAGTPSPTRT